MIRSILVLGLVVFAASSLPVSAEEGTSEPPAQPQAASAPTPDAVQDNLEVAVEYTLTIDGQVVESTVGKEPLRYVQGRQELISGFERGLSGMRIGESKELTLSPEEAYGSVVPDAVVEVAKAQLPADIKPEIGMVLRGMNPDGKSFRAKVTDIKGETVVLDLNHPYAGKTLHFAVKVVDIKPAQPQ